jgi:hypothetical protein
LHLTRAAVEVLQMRVTITVIFTTITLLGVAHANKLVVPGKGPRFGQVRVNGINYQLKRFRWGQNRARGVAIDGLKVLGGGKAIMDSRTAPALVQRLGGRITKVEPTSNRSFMVSYTLTAPGSNSLLERVERAVTRGPRARPVVKPADGAATERFVIGAASPTKTNRITGIQTAITVLTGDSALQREYAKTGWKRHPTRSYDAWGQMPAGSY